MIKGKKRYKFSLPILKKGRQQTITPRLVHSRIKKTEGPSWPCQWDGPQEGKKGELLGDHQHWVLGT